MKVKDMMSRTPATLDADDNVGVAAEKMGWAQVRHLPVLHAGRIIGMVSEHDVLASLTELGDLSGSRRPVREIMISPVQVIGPLADAAEAAEQMAVKGIHCLPVVEDGRLVGILTVTDLLARRAFGTPPLEPPSPSTVAAGVTVRDLVRPSPEIARADDLVLDAAARMVERDVRHLPVVDEQRRVIGILSDRDVRQAIGSPYRLVADAVLPEIMASLRVGAIMSAQPVTIRPDVSVAELARLLARRRVGAVPVVDDEDHLLGIVSYVDVLQAFVSAVRRP